MERDTIELDAPGKYKEDLEHEGQGREGQGIQKERKNIGETGKNRAGYNGLSYTGSGNCWAYAGFSSNQTQH